MILGLTPLLLTLTLSTPPPTINTTHHQETTMAQGTNAAPGGGKNRTNRGRAGELTPRLSYPIRHPNTPGPLAYRGPTRVGRIAKNPTEHTQRPGELR